MNIRATPHTRLRARDHYYTSKHSPWWKRWSLSKIASHYYAWGTTGLCECKMDVKIYVESYVAIEWIMFRGHLDCFQKNHLLEVGQKQNQEIMALWTLTTVDLFCFIMCENLYEIHWNSIWLRSRSHMASHYMILEMCLGRPLYTFLWALTISWSRLLAHVWSGP